MSASKSDRLFKLEAVRPQKQKRSIFDRVVAKRAPSLSIEEAFLAILIGAARADGSVSPEESQELAALCGRTITLSALSVAKVSEIQKRIEERFTKEGADKVLGAACHALIHERDAKPEETRMKAEAAFAHAVDIAFADRELHEDEQDYIEQLALQLEIPEDRVRAIAEVIEIKNSF